MAEIARKSAAVPLLLLSPDPFVACLLRQQAVHVKLVRRADIYMTVGNRG